MPRTADSIGTPSEMRWPKPGTHPCRCVRADPWKSPKKGTPAIMLTWETADSRGRFEDPVFLTSKALKRLNLVAQHVCGMPKTQQLPDSDADCVEFFRKFILDKAPDAFALVTIEVQVEEYMAQSGPQMGQKLTRNRSRVAFAGYDRYAPNDDAEPVAMAPPAAIECDEAPMEHSGDTEDELPF